MLYFCVMYLSMDIENLVTVECLRLGSYIDVFENTCYFAKCILSVDMIILES